MSAQPESLWGSAAAAGEEIDTLVNDLLTAILGLSTEAITKLDSYDEENGYEEYDEEIEYQRDLRSTLRLRLRMLLRGTLDMGTAETWMAKINERLKDVAPELESSESAVKTWSHRRMLHGKRAVATIRRTDQGHGTTLMIVDEKAKSEALTASKYAENEFRFASILIGEVIAKKNALEKIHANLKHQVDAKQQEDVAETKQDLLEDKLMRLQRSFELMQKNQKADFDSIMSDLRAEFPPNT
jgi:hypothetical protein